MTPLAQYFADQLTMPVKERTPFCAANSDRIRGALTDVHCFECSAVLGMLAEVWRPFEKLDGQDRSEAFGTLAFLPAPKTWVEFHTPVYGRVAMLLSEAKFKIATSISQHPIPCNSPDSAVVELFTAESGGGSYAGMISLVSDDHYAPGRHADGTPRAIVLPGVYKDLNIPGDQGLREMFTVAQLMLIAINSPRIVGRRQHLPHRALEKRLLATFGVGKFPLHAWTEIKLEIAKPVEIDDGEPHEAHLTGRRALHFCRKHIRIRRGALEYVRAHWRGDPALGIKQSRYVLQ